jgi:redox-sensitive bicupin YhaK (pirin superfamily)
MSRALVSRHEGQQHGFIRRMVSPGELGETLKPFVFLDELRGSVPAGAGFGFHPHSGIATLTYQLNADVEYEDTAGQRGRVRATGLEWMRAGGGTWHQGFLHPLEPVSHGFQLWLALPPGLEDGPPEGLYVPPEAVPQVGNVRVLLGEYGGHVSPIPPPAPLTYLDVALAAGESWVFTPPAGQTVAWAFVYAGRARVEGQPASRELLVFEESNAAVRFEALEATRVLLGAAQKHQHPLVLGSHSVHTTRAALSRGVARIRDVGEQLRSEGRL